MEKVRFVSKRAFLAAAYRRLPYLLLRSVKERRIEELAEADPQPAQSFLSEKTHGSRLFSSGVPPSSLSAEQTALFILFR